MAGRILVVDDDRAITQSLTRLLARDGYHVTVAHSAEDALDLVESDGEFDLILLDVGLPEKDGVACCRSIREKGHRMPVIMLTGRNAAWDKVSGLECGADDYLTKPVEPKELMARIKAQLRRWLEYGRVADASGRTELTATLVLDFNLRDAVNNGKRCRLTHREFELLALFARSPGRALSKEWIYQEIWGCASDMGIKVLAVYVRRLRQKLEEDADAPVFLKTVRGYGYALFNDLLDPVETLNA